MTVETAELVLNIITGIAVIVWMIVFRVLWGMNHRRPAPVNDRDADQYDVQQTPSADAASQLVCISSDKMQIAGNFEELSLRLARQVAQRLPAAKISSQTSNELVLAPISTSRWLGFERIDIAFTPLGENLTEVEHHVWQKPTRAPAWASWLSGLGLVVIVVSYLVLKKFVANYPNPAVRWQTIQMVQVIHFLWPPLMAIIPVKAQKTTGKAVAGVVDGMITNLPYVESPSAA